MKCFYCIIHKAWVYLLYFYLPNYKPCFTLISFWLSIISFEPNLHFSLDIQTWRSSCLFTLLSILFYSLVGEVKSTQDRRSALHLFRLGDAMLRIVRSKSRPLLHLMRCWSLVAPHLVEVGLGRKWKCVQGMAKLKQLKEA